jgi:hypothetical protein
MVKVLSFVIAISFALAVGAESQPPSPTPFEKSEQKKPPGAQNEAKTDENKTITEKLPLVINVNPSQVIHERSDPYAKESDKEPTGKWGNRSEFATAIFTGLLFIATVVLALFTFGLWSAGGKTAKKQLRAYVALEDIYFMWKDEFLPLAKREFSDTQRIRVKNYGPTSASNLRISVEKTMSRERPMHMSVEVASYTLPPNQRFGRTLTETLAFRSTTEPFWTHGEVSYTDIYGHWWVSEFCFRYDGMGRFTPDTEHNRERGPYSARPA